jgi:hypothetical protein
LSTKTEKNYIFVVFRRVALLFSHDSKHALDFMPYTDRDQYKVNKTCKAARPIIFLSRRSRLFPDSLLLVPPSSYGE